jgi:hypothetical protein
VTLLRGCNCHIQVVSKPLKLALRNPVCMIISMVEAEPELHLHPMKQVARSHVRALKLVQVLLGLGLKIND